MAACLPIAPRSTCSVFLNPIFSLSPSVHPSLKGQTDEKLNFDEHIYTLVDGGYPTLLYKINHSNLIYCVPLSTPNYD